MTADPQQMMQNYFDLMTMNGGSHVFRESRRHGVFEALAAGGATPAEIARTTGLETRALEFLLPVLVQLGCATRNGEAYALSPLMGLLQGDYANLSDDYWAHLPAFLQSGAPFKTMDDSGESEAHYLKQVKSLEWMMAPSAGALAGEHTPKGPCHVLDVGAGSGIWGLSLLEHNPEARLTVLDWPAITKIALAAATARGQRSRVEAIDGDAHEVELPEQMFDVAVLANVAHLETSESLCALLKKIRKSLTSTGRVYLVDVFAEQPGGRLAASLYSLGLALRTRSGQAHTHDALAGVAEAAGYTSATFHPLKAVPYTMGVVIVSQ